MTEHFAELKNFITFSVTRQITQLRTEFKRDIRSVEQRLGGVEQRLGGRIDSLERRFDGLDRKFDAHHEAIKLILSDILDRLPARDG